MKKTTVLALGIFAIVQMKASAVWINEIHYDNSGGDTGEGVEIAGVAGTDLTGWSIILYNGSGGAAYRTTALTGTIDDEGSGFGALSFSMSGIQNGAPDGLALVDGSNVVAEFLSYEGFFMATSGPANGMTSTDIGVSEMSSTGAGQSLQRFGNGSSATDFSWRGPLAASAGTLNEGQVFPEKVPDPTGGANNVPDGGTTAFLLLGGLALLTIKRRANTLP